MYWKCSKCGEVTFCGSVKYLRIVKETHICKVDSRSIFSKEGFGNVPNIPRR
jgi:hypothetical protein